MQVRLMLGLLLLVQLLDAATFALGVDLHGIGLESNGIAVVIYHHAGLDGVLIAKLLVILVTIGTLVLAVRPFPRLVVWGAAAATAMGLLGVLSNIGSLVILGA